MQHQHRVAAAGLLLHIYCCIQDLKGTQEDNCWDSKVFASNNNNLESNLGSKFVVIPVFNKSIHLSVTISPGCLRKEEIDAQRNKVNLAKIMA